MPTHTDQLLARIRTLIHLAKLEDSYGAELANTIQQLDIELTTCAPLPEQWQDR